MIVFGFVSVGIGSQKSGSYFEAMVNLAGCVVFTAGIIGLTFVQRKIVELTKQTHPEKTGDVLEMHFQKKWIASCDEQERQQVYKAACKAFTTGQILYPALLLILLLGELFLGIGVAPMLVLGVMWLTQTIAYQVECMKKR